MKFKMRKNKCNFNLLNTNLLWDDCCQRWTRRPPPPWHVESKRLCNQKETEKDDLEYQNFNLKHTQKV